MQITLKLAGFCLLALSLLMLGTSPERLPSIMLIVPFAMVFIILLLGFFAIMRVKGVAKARSLRLGAFGAALPTLLLVLQSLGQLTFRDVLTILVLFGMAYFYMTRIATRANE